MISKGCNQRHHERCRQGLICTCRCHLDEPCGGLAIPPTKITNWDKVLRQESIETPDELSKRIEKAGTRKAQRVGQQMRFMRTCTWDIEASNLNANFGIILCSSIKPIEQEVTVHRIDDDPEYDQHRWDDAYLVESIRDELEKYQVIVGYNHISYDLPMLETRLMKHGLRPLDKTNMCLVDLLWAARYRMRLSSNTLERLSEFLGTESHKTPILGELWIKATAGDRKSLDHIVEHNIHDVEVLEEVADQLSRFVKLQYKLVK